MTVETFREELENLKRAIDMSIEIIDMSPSIMVEMKPGDPFVHRYDGFDFVIGNYGVKNINRDLSDR